MRPSLDKVQKAVNESVLNGTLDRYLTITKSNPSASLRNNLDPAILVPNYGTNERVFLKITHDRTQFLAYQKQECLIIELGYVDYNTKKALIAKNRKSKMAQETPTTTKETKATKPKVTTKSAKADK